MVLLLTLKSLRNRKMTTVLTIGAIALSIALLVGVERVRQGAKEGFSGTISKTDLIVGAKGGSIQLLLYSVFRIGSATENLRFDTYEVIRDWPEVAWTIPISLGDSHRGYRVVGTDESFYKHYKYRQGRSITFEEGKAPTELFDVVLGSEVAETLGYTIDQQLILTHGISAEAAFQKHENKPFTVVGILATTGTPVDRSLYVSLEGITAMHVDWTDGAPPLAADATRPDELQDQTLEVDQITAFLLGANSRLDTLMLQRRINQISSEPLMAIIPGVTLSELWEGISYAETALQVVSLLVVLVGLIGMLVSLYHSLSQRRREMAILRSIGAGPKLIVGLLLGETFVMTVSGVLLGVASAYGILIMVQPFVEDQFGLYLALMPLQTYEVVYLVAMIGLALLLSLLPAIRAYRNTLHDGLGIRL